MKNLTTKSYNAQDDYSQNNYSQENDTRKLKKQLKDELESLENIIQNTAILYLKEMTETEQKALISGTNKLNITEKKAIAKGLKIALKAIILNYEKAEKCKK